MGPIQPGALDAGQNTEQFDSSVDTKNLNDPRVVLSLLEADQVVATKRQTHFGRRELSLSVRTLLWGLRIYVVVMIAIVLVAAFHALRGAR